MWHKLPRTERSTQMKSLSCVWVKILSPPADDEYVCPDEGDYFGQNMRTVYRKMLTTSLKCNSRRPHEKPKRQQKDFVPRRGVFLVWWHYGCKNHHNETLFLSKRIIRLHRSGSDCRRLLPSTRHFLPLLSSQEPLWKETVNLHSSRVTGFL